MIAHRKPLAPTYSTLSNVELILDATGLRDNTNNSYGQVTDGVAQIWKGLAPGRTDIDFNAQPVGVAGEGSVLKFIDGFIEFAGQVLFRSNNPGDVYNFFSYASPVGNLKSTLHIVMKVGDDANPELIYGIVGNNQSSQGSKGMNVFYDDRSSLSKNDELSSNITKGTTGYIIEARPQNIITPNVPFVLTIETDMALAAADRQRFFINGVQFAFTVLSPSTAVVDVPSYQMEIGGVGNSVLPFRGWISHVIMQSGIETSGVRDAFIQSLLPYKNKTNSDYFYRADESIAYGLSQRTFLSESIYYLNVAVEKNPVTGNILCVFGQWTSAGHAWSDGNVVMFRKSTGDVNAFATKATAFDPGANRGTIDCGFFFDTNGVGHGFTNTMDGTGTTSTPGTSKIFYFTTSDDGDTWSSSEVTTPVDGLDFTACYGNGYTANGYNWFTVYRQDDGAANSARYILKWALGSNISTIEWVLIESGTTYINEGSIVHLGGSSHLLVCRNESTLEWTQYYTANDWSTNVNQGDLTFGETNTVAGPVRIVKFPIYHNGVATDIIKCYYPLRGTAILKAVYALPSNIIATGLTGWDLDTVETIVDDTEIIHYGGAYHYGFNFFAVYTREVVSSETSTLISFRGPTTKRLKVLIQLGLT